MSDLGNLLLAFAVLTVIYIVGGLIGIHPSIAEVLLVAIATGAFFGIRDIRE